MIKDKLYQESVERLGFTKITLGDDALCEGLQKIYLKYWGSNSQISDMAVTHNNPDDNRALDIHKEIVSVAQPYLENTFENFQILASHFVIKKANSQESFQLHQDWNVVDEKKYYNFQVWIPLELSYPENGGLCFIPESHLFFENIRSGSFGIPSIRLEESIYPFLSFLRLFPGEAAVFYSKTFHGSFINSSPKDRVAVLINIIQAKATPLYFHFEENNLFSFKITTEYIFKNLHSLEKGIKPLNNEYTVNSIFPEFDNKYLSLEYLLQKIKKQNICLNRSLEYEHKLYSIINNDEFEKEINHMGYAIVNLLNISEIDLLKNKFAEVFPDRTQYIGAYSTMSEMSPSERKSIHHFTFNTVKKSLDKYFKDYNSPISLLYSRNPDNEYLLEWHSDPSLIFNENIEPLYGIWCPLLDVNNEHGALKVIPGSHRLQNKLNFAYKTTNFNLDEKRKILEKFGVSFNLKAGEAIIFDARIIHGSDPNKSKVCRDNFVMRICHKNSKFFNMITENKNAQKGIVYVQNEEYFYDEVNTIKEHNITPNTGKKAGIMYLFDADLSDKKLIEKLSPYHYDQ